MVDSTKATELIMDKLNEYLYSDRYDPAVMYQINKTLLDIYNDAGNTSYESDSDGVVINKNLYILFHHNIYTFNIIKSIFLEYNFCRFFLFINGFIRDLYNRIAGIFSTLTNKYISL